MVAGVEGLAGLLRTADCLSIYLLWDWEGSDGVGELLLCAIVPSLSLPPCRKRWADYQLPKNQEARDSLS